MKVIYLLVLGLVLGLGAQDVILPDEQPSKDELQAKVKELEHTVEVLEIRNGQFAAQIQDLQNKAALGVTEKSRWFGYKMAQRKGAFDMMEVCAWEGSQIRQNGPWNYTIKFRFSQVTAVLDEAQFALFANAFEAYLNRLQN